VTDEGLKRLIESSAVETRRQIGVVAENLDNKIQVVAEVLNGKIDSLRADVNRGFTDVDRQFLETQAMIKFSHSELDKRIRTLEGTVADHETRLERLEGTNRPS
jgi:hypothetical protein